MPHSVVRLVLALLLLAAPLAGQVPAAWTLAFQDDFERPIYSPDLAPWASYGEQWEVRDGALHRRGARGNGLIFLSRAFPGNQRLEFDCRAEEPQDFFAILSAVRQHWDAGYLFAYSVGKPSAFRMAGKEVAGGLPAGELGRWHHVVCQVEDYQITWRVDDKVYLDRPLTPALRGAASGLIGFYCYAASGEIDNVVVYTKPNGEVGKEGATGVDVKPPTARPVVVTPSHDTDYTPSSEYVTPHVPFAKPYAQGPVNALVCAWAAAGRTVVELQERMDLTFDYVSAGPENRTWRGSALRRVADDEVARVKSLLAKPHEVIVLGALPWNWYPEDVRTEILRQVEGGTGLVYSHTDMPREADGKLYELFQAARPAKGYFPSDRARMTAHGRGRVAFEMLRDEWRFDSHLAYFSGFTAEGVEQLARTILWAAGKEPSVTVEVDAAQPATVRLAGRLPGGATLRWDVRRDLSKSYPMLYGLVPYQLREYPSQELVSTTETQATAGAHATTLPQVPGEYRLTATVLDPAGRVLTWRDVAYTVRPAGVPPSLRVGPTAENLVRADGVLPAVGFNPADTLHAAADFGAEAGNAVRLTLTDRDGRVVAMDTKPAGQPFALLLQRSLHRLLIAKAEALAGDLVRAEVRAPVVVDLPPGREPAYRMRLYGVSLLRPELTAEDISYRTGYRLNAGEGALMHAWYDVELGDFSGALPQAKRISPEGVRAPCLNDPAFVQKMHDAVKQFVAPAAPFGFRILLGDEWTYAYQEGHKLAWPELANQCRSPYCLAAFRVWLQQRYADLPALNRVWGSAYTDWTQIEPPRYGDSAPPEADWPRVVDHRTFVEDTVAGYLAGLAAAAREVSPRVQVGTSGHYTAGMWTGRDFAAWAKAAPHIVTYREVNLWQSLIPEPVGAWIGYGAELENPAKEGYRAWRDLLNGVETAYWGREMPPFAPDFTLLEAPAVYFAERRFLRDSGLADLLVSQPQQAPVAILYHRRSLTVVSLHDWQADPVAFVKASLRNNGMPAHLGAYMDRLPAGAARWITIEQLAEEQPQMLLLPQTESLSDAEVAALRRYVERGGTLVADLNPAVRDEHGRARATGALYHLCGIRRAVTKLPAEGPAKLTVVEFGAYYAGGAVEAAGATAAGKIRADGQEFPAVLTRTVGKGRTVYLNFVPKPETMTSLVTYLGLRQDWRVEATAPQVLTAVREYHNGSHRYYGVAGNSNLSAEQLAKGSATLVLDQPGHLYDLRAGAYLGHGDHIRVTFQAPDRLGNVFAVLPYQVEAVVLDGLQPAYQAGDSITLTARVTPAPTDQSHFLRVRLRDPHGSEVVGQGRRVWTTAGSARVTLPLALNDPAGEWLVEVTDVASGVKGLARVRVNS